MSSVSPIRNLEDNLNIKPSDINKFSKLFFDMSFDDVFKIINDKNKKGELKFRYFNNFINLLNDIIGIIPNGMSLYRTITKKKNSKNYKLLNYLSQLSTLIFFDTQNITSFKNLKSLKETFLNTFYFLNTLLEYEDLLIEINNVTKGQCYISDLIDDLLNYFTKFINVNIKNTNDKSNTIQHTDNQINDYKLKNNINLFTDDFKKFAKEQLAILKKKEKLSKSEENDILTYKNINNILKQYSQFVKHNK